MSLFIEIYKKKPYKKKNEYKEFISRYSTNQQIIFFLI